MLIRAGLIPVPIAVLLMVISGCSGSSDGPQPEDPKAVVPLVGVVYCDGEPVEMLGVLCIPADQVKDEEIDVDSSCESSGITDANGKFAVSTYFSGDGAPPGDYVLVFRRPSGKFFSDKLDSKALQAFSRKYGNSSKSEFKVTLEAGKPVDMGKLELTSK